MRLLISLFISIFFLNIPMASSQSIPDYVNIRRIVYNGSGCPLGTVGKNVSPDRQAFTLTFSEYLAEAGPGLSFADSRKNCQITIVLDFPNGWTFSVMSIDYRGFAYLDEGVKGIHSATYYFQGQGQTGRSSRTLQGDYYGDYFMRDYIGMSSLVWSPCGARRALNINSAVRVDNRSNRSGQGLMTIDSIDGEVIYTFNLQWRRCRD